MGRRIWRHPLGLATAWAGLTGCVTTDLDPSLDASHGSFGRESSAHFRVSEPILPQTLERDAENSPAPPQRSALPGAASRPLNSGTASVRSKPLQHTHDREDHQGPERATAASSPPEAIIQVSQLVPPPPAPDDAAPAELSKTPDEAATPDVLSSSVTAPSLLSDGKPIDLGSALALVAGQNPEVNFARAQVREAYAQLDAAEILWVPNLQAGVNYHRHEGQLQDVGGAIVDINRSSLNAGLGAGAIGAGSTTAPGLVIDIDAADAIFGPEIARRAAWASRHAADAAVNDQLLNVALAYLQLAAAEQRAVIARETVANATDLAETTEDFATTGQGLQADAERATTELRLRRNELLRVEEEAAVASARLAQLIRLSPSERLIPMEVVPVPIDLVAAECDAQDLVTQALRRRPELRQQQALVEQALARLKQERYAPLIPSVLVGASYSGFGGGIGDRVGDFHDRADFDAMAVWQVRNLGFGERAARNAASARVDQNRFRQLQTMDLVAREVVEAQAQVQARSRQIATAEEAVAAAEQSYRLNRQRISEAQGLPIETLQAIQSLDAARRDYVRAVTDYNEAQFRLHRALGWPIQ